MPIRSHAFIATLAGIITSALAAPAGAGPAPLSQSVVVDRAAGDATFILDFGHHPDLGTIEPDGNPADAFQYEIAADPMAGASDLANLTSIIRGSEIGASSQVPIRDAAPADVADLQAGGWGPIRGYAPFTLDESQLTLTAPLSLLGAPDGDFAYRVFTLRDGSIVSQAQGPSQSVPLPPAICTGASGLALLILLALARATRPQPQ
jgi:hypothetical protein